MATLWFILAFYLGFGLLFLIVFQLTTHRIGKRLQDVSADVQTRLNTAGGGVGVVTTKVAIAITLIYAWLFWVAILVGYLLDIYDHKQEKK